MARKPDDWMPLHIGKYLADTTHLTRDQHGAYLLLLMAYWRRGGPLVADDARLAATAKATTAEWRRLKPVLAEFFTVENGMWVQKRAQAELTKAVAITEAKSAAGKKGAEKKWQNTGKCDGKRMAEPDVCHRQNDAPSPSPEQETIENTDFESFFSAYPRQEQRDAAEREYLAAIGAGVTAADLLAGAKRFAAHVEREKIPARFVAMAKTWLADGCWKDRYGETETAPVLPDLDPSWAPATAQRWSKNLGEVNFRTYFGPAEYIDIDPPILRYRSSALRRLAEDKFPRVCREVALEVAA